jgi:hypothetical protein
MDHTFALPFATVPLAFVRSIFLEILEYQKPVIKFN